MYFTHLEKKYPQMVLSSGYNYFRIVALSFILLFSLQTHAIATQLVKVGVYENSPKIFVDANGKVSGFWPELIEYIAKQENWQIKYIQGTWVEGLGRLKKGEIDIMPDVAYTEKRNAIYAFSKEPVLMSWSMIYVPNDDFSILSIRDLDGKQIAVLKGSANFEGVDGIKDITAKFNLHCTFITFDSYRDVFKAVEDKRVAAGVTNKNFGDENARNFRIKKTPIIFHPINLRFAFPAAGHLTPDLQNKINRQIGIMRKDPQSIYYKLLQKYFDTRKTEKKADIPSWFITILEILAGIGFILILTIIYSRVQVRRKTAELSSQKELLEAITENIPGVVYQFYYSNDGESGVRYCSAKLFDIFDLKFINDPPVLLQTFVGNIHADDRQSFIDSVQDAAEKQISWDWQGRYVKPSGDIIWFQGLSTPIVRQDEIAFNGILLDITTVKKLEEEQQIAETQLHRSQKMEAIGMMAGGVAHDLNNILSGIISYPELMLLDLPQDSPLRDPIETIKDSGLRAAAVVADLLTVARGAAAVKEVCDLNKLLLEYLDSPELKRPLADQPDITIHKDFSQDLLNITCSVTHIRKCLLNLFINACEAVGKNGVITVRTRNRYVDRPLKGYEEVRKGEYVVLSVADNGSGIAPKDINHIFEPFYSKKVMGRSGTGLGLAVVWSAVQDHNGYIDITTSNNGTCFDLYFPASRELPESDKKQINIKEIQGNGQTILVIDDEATQRDIVSTMLNLLDYKPTSVASGEEAVAFLQSHKVDLLVLDMIMDPNMNGRQTYEKIISLHPGQKAIIASGFSETDEVKKAQKLGAGIFIRKPYTIYQLGKAVKQELEK